MSLSVEFPDVAEDIIPNDKIVYGQILKDPSDTPTEERWVMPYLRRKDKDSSIREWVVGYDPKLFSLIVRYGTLITSKGEPGSEYQTQYVPIESKASRSLQDQALLEARTRYKNTCRNGYHREGENAIPRIRKQLAHPLIHPKNGKWKLNEKHYKNGVSCQRKIDGFRGVVWYDDVVFKSKKGIPYKWLDEMTKCISVLFSYLPPCGLDGELYNHELTFQQIASALKQKTHKSENNKLIKYMIFDIIIPEMTTNDRFDILDKAFKNYIEDGNSLEYVVFVGHDICHAQDDIIKLREKYDNEGYEGLMVRKRVGDNPTASEMKESYYTGKRNNNLLKYKLFDDDEALVIDVFRGSKDVAVFFIEWKGLRFKCNPGSSVKQRQYWYEHKEECIGHIYTFRYKANDFTEKGIPKTATGKSFRDNDFKDGRGNIVSIRKYNNNNNNNNNNSDSYDIAEFELKLENGANVWCIPSATESEHKDILSSENEHSYIGKMYSFKYKDTLKDKITPEYCIGTEFI